MLREHGDLLAPIAAGGALGSLARWGLAAALPNGDAHEWALPWATFVTNVSGCLLIGALMALVLGPWSHTRYLRPFLGVGVLGGYTTFSTYELETYALVSTGSTTGGLLALLYLIVSVIAGVVATWIGLTLGRVLVLDSGSEVVVGGIDPDLDPDSARGDDR